MKERIVILGGGESGTGAAILAKAKGFDVFVSDMGPLKDNYRDDLTSLSIPFEEGGHTDEKVLSATLIIKSPGIGKKADVVRKARTKKIPIIDEVEFAFLAS